MTHAKPNASRQQARVILIAGPLSGVLAIDVDSEAAEAVWVERRGGVPDAPRVYSGSGDPSRFHLYFEHPHFETKAKATPWHAELEFRGNAGLLVLPPSVHRSGGRYRWSNVEDPCEIVLPPLPAEVVAALIQRRPISHETALEQRPLRSAIGLAPSTRAFLDGQLADEAGWNDRLFRAACDMKACGINQSDAEAALIAGSRPWTDSDVDIASRTIDSAYSRQREPSRR